MNASTMLSYITSTHLADGKWKGTTHAFILHWQDQVQKYHDLSSQTLSNDILCTLLQNAVHPIAELRQVKVQADQFKMHTKQSLTYDEYCALLLSAAQQYNVQRAGKSKKVATQCIYEHNICRSSDNFHDTEMFDIDSPCDTIQAYATNYMQGLQLPYDKWHALPADAQKIWDSLSPEAKTIILCPPPKPDPDLQLQQHPPNQHFLP